MTNEAEEDNGDESRCSHRLGRHAVTPMNPSPSPGRSRGRSLALALPHVGTCVELSSVTRSFPPTARSLPGWIP